jgi:Glycosyltransferase family 87
MRARAAGFDPEDVSAAAQKGTRMPGYGRAGRNVLKLAWVALLPVFVGLYIVESLRHGHNAWAIDFNGNFRMPAQEILHGTSPYHPGELETVRAAVDAGHSPIEFQHGVFASYPAPGLLLGVPFTALPVAIAEWVWLCCMLAAGGLALRLAGARDWRVYAAAALAAPVVSSLYYGAVELLLMLGLAACWRWRDHAGRAGLALGAIIALKLIALPLVIWLVATRRWAAAAVSVGVAGALTAAGWALLGFRGLMGYPHLLSLLTEIESARGYSSVALANALGAGQSTAALAPWALGLCLVAALCILSRRGRSSDATTFFLAVLAVLAFSPIVWQHSLALLLVPLAIVRPRFHPVWTLPVLLWSTPDTADLVPAFRLGVCLLVVAAISVWALRAQAPRTSSHEGSRHRSSESMTLA